MKLRIKEIGAAALAVTTLVSLSTVAHAQDTAPPPATGTVDAQGSAAVGASTTPSPSPSPSMEASPSTSTGMTLPGAAPPPPAATGDSDHDSVIGTFGVGFLGVVNVATAGNPFPPSNLGSGTLTTGCTGGDICANNATPVSAPIIGVRYWVNQMVGIDAGLGFGIFSFGGSSDAGGPKQDLKRPSENAFVLHGGVPLALASSGHFTFEVIPEINLGFANWSVDQQNGPSLDGNAFHFDIGARVGAEIHFGFIGIPKLALQGSVGLQLASDSGKSQQAGGTNNGVTTNKFSSFGLGTTLGTGSPWDIFRGSIAALYYF